MGDRSQEPKASGGKDADPLGAVRDLLGESADRGSDDADRRRPDAGDPEHAGGGGDAPGAGGGSRDADEAGAGDDASDDEEAPAGGDLDAGDVDAEAAGDDDGDDDPGRDDVLDADDETGRDGDIGSDDDLAAAKDAALDNDRDVADADRGAETADASRDRARPRPGAARAGMPETGVAPSRAAPPLHPDTPEMGLSDLLRRDAVMNIPKHRGARLAIAGVGLFGLFLTVIGAARSRAGTDVDVLGPLRIGHIGLILAMLALWAFLILRFVAGDKVLRVPLAPSQGDQWQEVQSQARLMQFGQWIGVGGAVAGLAILALSLAYIDGGGVVLAAGLGGVMATASLALILIMEARRGPLRVLYVQTLMLSRLEEAGVSSRLAVDPRTARVLESLDSLLGDLPESSVRRFLSSEEARWYLELVDQARGGGRGK